MRLKRLTVPWAIKRKEHKYVTAPRGPHSLRQSLPLISVVRDLLGLAENANEAKKIIKRGDLKVDGRVRKDKKYGVGLFDVIEIGKKFYRVLPGKRMRLVEIPSKESMLKICKIKSKKAVKGGKIQLNLHDGRNILTDKKEYKVNDSILIKVPQQEIVSHIKFEPGTTVLITTGKHAGEIAKLKNYEKGLNKRVLLEKEKGVFESSFDAIICVGKDKPEISLGEISE